MEKVINQVNEGKSGLKEKTKKDLVEMIREFDLLKELLEEKKDKEN
jgi:hypothetical protein